MFILVSAVLLLGCTQERKPTREFRAYIKLYEFGFGITLPTDRWKMVDAPLGLSDDGSGEEQRIVWLENDRMGAWLVVVFRDDTRDLSEIVSDDVKSAHKSIKVSSIEHDPSGKRSSFTVGDRDSRDSDFKGQVVYIRLPGRSGGTVIIEWLARTEYFQEVRSEVEALENGIVPF